MDNTRKKSPQSKNQTPILLGFAVRQRGPSGKWQIRFRWGRIFATLGFLTILGYCSFASAIYFYFKYYRNYDEANYWKMYTVLFRLPEHRAEMGDYQIEKAKELLKEREIRKAFQNLRSGVAKSPSNLEGRTLLSEFFIVAIKRPELAVDVLRRGVRYANNDPEYLKKYIQILLNYQHDSDVIKLAESILEQDPIDEVKHLMALGAATAHHYRGNFDQAEDLINEYIDDTDLEGMLLKTRITWDRGQREAAISKLEESINKFPNNEPIYAFLSRFYREMDNIEKARQYAVLRNINTPLSVAPRIDLLYILNTTKQEERAKRESEAILKQFKSDEKSLLNLANYATDTAQVELARRIYEQALENDFGIAPFALLLIEAHITSEDYEGAISFTEELIKERPDWLDRTWGIFNSLRAVAYFGVGNRDLSNIYLNQFLKEPEVRVESLIAVSKRFEDLQGKEEARQILYQAFTNNPDNQAALSRLIGLEIELGNSAELGGYLKRLLQMRRPSVELLEEAYRKLGSDRFIFTQDRADLLIELNSMLYKQSQAS